MPRRIGAQANAIGQTGAVSWYTPGQFKAWQKTLGWANRQVADALECSMHRVSYFRKNGCGHSVALACRAIALQEGHVVNEVRYPWEDRV